MNEERQFSLTIDMDNASFDPDPTEEVIRILRSIAKHLESSHVGLRIQDEGTSRDRNGNTVARWETKGA